MGDPTSKQDRIAGRCHGDWQGPSDNRGEDDLLVVQCDNATAHDRIRCVNVSRGRAHSGIIDVDGNKMRVYWLSIAGNLYSDPNTSRLVRSQFA